MRFVRIGNIGTCERLLTEVVISDYVMFPLVIMAMNGDITGGFNSDCEIQGNLVVGYLTIQ